MECQSSTNSSHRMRILQFRYWLNSLVNSLISCPNVHIFVLLMANHFANFLMVLLSDATHLPLHTMTRPCRPTSHSLPGPYPTPARSMRSKRVSHPIFFLDLMNFGSWNQSQKALKPGAPLNPSWALSICRTIPLYFVLWLTNGDYAMKFLQLHSRLTPLHTWTLYVLPHPEHLQHHFWTAGFRDSRPHLHFTSMLGPICASTFPR